MAPRPPGPTWLYKVYDAADELIYVGITFQPRRRIYEHQYEHRLDDAVRIIWQRFPTRAEAARAEAALIRTEHPSGNGGVFGRDAIFANPTCPYCGSVREVA